METVRLKQAIRWALMLMTMGLGACQEACSETNNFVGETEEEVIADMPAPQPDMTEPAMEDLAPSLGSV